MRNRLYKILPWAAVVGATMVIIGLIYSISVRSQMLKDTGETTRIVNAALDQVVQLNPSSIEDTALDTAIDELGSSPYVVSTWLIDPQGKIVSSQGLMAFDENVQDRISVSFERILASLPGESLSSEQTLLLNAAYAIQAEGEHNDVYLHQVRPLHDASGNLVALVGVAYDISTEANAPVDAGWIVSVLMVAVGFLLYWLSLPIWTYLDAKMKGEPALIWAFFILLGNLIGLIAYLLVKSAPRQATTSK